MLCDHAVVPAFLVQMFFGIWLVHMKHGWFVVGHGFNGMEYSVTIICALVAVVLTAPTPARRSAPTIPTT